MFFKVVHNKQVPIYNSKVQSSFEALHKHIQEVFKQLPAKYYLTYFDEEDEITLACESDFEAMKQLSQKTAKIFIKEVDESYYDETQKVVLDDEAVEPLEEKMEELKLSESEDHVDLSEQEPEALVDNSATDAKVGLMPVAEGDSQPEIIQEKNESKIEEYNPILDQSQISQITEADIEDKFREMMPEFMEKVKDSLLRKSTVQSEASQKPRVVHNHITCDQCGQTNMEGVRYKCAVCADFDLCEKCEATSSHTHPFLKIKRPSQAPYKLIAIIRDEEENSFEVNGQRVQLPQFPFVNQLFDAFCGRPERSHEERHGPHGFGRGFGFGRGRHGCPFKKNYENEEMKEEKSEPQKKTKVEEEVKPVEKKVEQKVEPKVQLKVEPKVEKKNVPVENIPQRRETMEVEKNTSSSLVENAGYLFDCLNGWAQITQDQTYEFALKHPKMTKQQLLEIYFSEKN